MKSKLFLIAFMLASAFCFAQNVEISGQVNEAATGLPIPGVSIIVKNSTGGTTTDIDGNFSISVPTGSTLVFSYIGFEPQEVVAIANQTITITLKESTETLDEVVVIGYGSQKKKEVTGAVSVVTAQTLERIRPIKVEQALQGTVSGVNVTTQSGAPGAGLSIRIRGVGTNGEAGPIAIIDGYQGELGLLNPQDIETITVLKDAQAAIYGTIGANGIILVTTKKGRKNQKPTLSYNFYTGFQETTRTLPTLNATQYASYLNESYSNAGSALPYPNVGGLGEGTNWQNEVFGKNVPIISHDVNLQGGSEKLTYAVSGSHIDQEGLVGGEKSAFLRNTARLSLGADLTDKLKLNTNVIYTYFNRRNLNENALGSVLFNALNVSPLQQPRDENGEYTLVPVIGFGDEIINPLAQTENTYNTYHFKKLNGTFGLDYELIKGLTITGRIGFNTVNSESKTFSPIISYGGTKVFNNTRSSVTQGAVNDNSYTFDLFATYQKSIAESHNFTFTVGNTIYKEWGNGLYATGYDVPNNSWEFADINLANGLPTQKPVSSYTYDERRLSYFGRLQYDFKGRYLLSAMIRRDASTKFGPDNRVGYFPSFTGGWVVSDEPFFKQNNILSFAKIRASYGTLGNDQIGNNRYVSLLSGEAMYVFDNALTAGTATGPIPNPKVKWEEAKKFDVGVDLNFFNNDVTLVADYFVDTRKDLLIPSIPVSGILGGGAPGAGLPTLNAGDVKNYGVELAVGYKKNITDDFSIDVNYNVTFLKNKVTKVDNATGWLQDGNFGTGEPAARMEVGRPMGYFYGYRTDGIFQNQAEVDAAPSQSGLGSQTTQPGDIRFVDMNGDGIINANDKTEIGDPIPSVTMGFNINLQYKGFDFTAYTFASIGNDMLRNYERTVPNANRLNYVLDRWTGEGTSNTVPRATTGATNNNVISDYFVEDASYVRIQNVQLGYTFDEKLIGKSGVSKLRLYVGVNNLYTFTKYMGYDPGASSGAPIGSGIDYGFYPIPRTYMVGANINF
ncbi:TonB-dependent receptor [Flavobacterium sp. MFBS3-15]|uniref:SusC/RagA family TonB-linked outer membrane protein n=1 Tax=Flavobacterium sp. MFBS3-15 TaxID=2989816 RepID=UPI0022358A3A|nr:TonB-dependent receptor [Flavobacterium sp. MFBS3-15]MCW4468531.1 TonB-dependent receptor [Flavobacterium sp. MFBS3-15]